MEQTAEKQTQPEQIKPKISRIFVELDAGLIIDIRRLAPPDYEQFLNFVDVIRARYIAELQNKPKTPEPDEKYPKINNRMDYNILLQSGMLFELHPELSGDWEKDKEIIFAKK